jgi:hypothetical protein
MKDCRQFYIDGKWVSPTKTHDFPVINPATEAQIATISLGTATVVGWLNAFCPFRCGCSTTRGLVLRRPSL